MVYPNEHRFFPLRAFGALGVAALLVWITAVGSASAGIIVNCDAMSISEMGASESPAAPVPAFPQTRDVRQPASFFFSTLSESGGATSQAPTPSSGVGFVAFLTGRPAFEQAPLTSRITDSIRISLPSPLEDRFFRPPRLV